MKRNRTILLNKAVQALKILKYEYINIKMNYSSIDLTIPGITSINHDVWEDLIIMFNKKNINWKLSFKDTYIVLNIWI